MLVTLRLTREGGHSEMRTFGGGLKAAQVLTELFASLRFETLQLSGTARPDPPLRDFQRLKRLSLPCRISSLTAVSCGGFLDFPATGKLGEIPSARAARTVRRDCKNAPAKLYTHSKRWKPQRTQETINRSQNLYENQRKSCFLKNLRNDSFMILKPSHVRRLRQYGYRSYGQYLQSEAWRSVRQRYYRSKLFKGGCEACGFKGALEIHHRSYTRICKEKLQDLVALCRDCHERTHNAIGGNCTLMNAHKKVRWERRKEQKIYAKYAKPAKQFDTSPANPPRYWHQNRIIDAIRDRILRESQNL